MSVDIQRFGSLILVKARVCTTNQEAERIASNTGIANALGVSTPKAIQTHHKLNYPLPHLEGQLNSQLNALLTNSYSLIHGRLGTESSDKVRALIEYRRPHKLIEEIG